MLRGAQRRHVERVPLLRQVHELCRRRPHAVQLRQHGDGCRARRGGGRRRRLLQHGRVLQHGAAAPGFKATHLMASAARPPSLYQTNSFIIFSNDVDDCLSKLKHNILHEFREYIMKSRILGNFENVISRQQKIGQLSSSKPQRISSFERQSDNSTHVRQKFSAPVC